MRVSNLLLSSLVTFGLGSCAPPLRTLQLSPDEIIVVPESEKLQLLRRGVHFMDITNHIPFLKSESEPIAVEYNYPKSLSNQESVKELVAAIDTNSMYDTLAELTSFYTRYYKSSYGLEAANWMYERITNITSEIDEKNLFTITKVKHSEWDQYSIVLSIKGTETPDDIVVIGSHFDSINLILPSILGAPGADDNGSGTTTCLEALRLIVQYLKNGGSFKNTVEFHFYSAEEGGLLGSLDVFTRYKNEGKTVMAMLQQDMTGYVADENDEHVGLVTDYTSKGLNNFLTKVIDEYLDIKYVETKCGYACSDHGSAMKNGYPAAFVIEGEFKRTNHYIHSTMDTMDRLSISHMAEHTKLVLGTALELGGWKFTKLDSQL